MTDQDIDAMANAYAQRFFYPGLGVPKVIDLIKALGLRLVVEKTTVEDLSGVIYEHRKQWVLFVNENDPGRRRLWTMGHECGHWLLHRSLVGNPTLHCNRRREDEANRFAAGFLLPEWLIRTYASKTSSVRVLSEWCKVSELALRRRLWQLHIVTAGDKLIINEGPNREPAIVEEETASQRFGTAVGIAAQVSSVTVVEFAARKQFLGKEEELMTTHSKRVCTSCGKEALRDEALFCRDCGTPLTNRCTQCDAVLEDDEGYCEFCGAESYYKAHKLDPFADDEMEDPTSYATNELPDDLPF